jgi:DNA topoisomerase-1
VGVVGEVLLLPDSYILVIAEKPRAAAKIAEALGARTRVRIDGLNVWVGRLGRDYVVIAPTAGHLYTLYTEDRDYPTFNYSWGPRWLYEKGSEHLRRYYNVLKKLAGRARYFINACDYDIEGSVIGYNIIYHLGDVKRAYRVKFSTLTKEELVRAFSNLQPLDWGNIESGIARHVLDWIWGINISRALSDIVSRLYGRRAVLSAGRVQSPTLLELVRRYLERATFVPEVGFTLSVKVVYGGREYGLENLFQPFRKLSDTRKVLETLKESSRLVVERVERREVRLPPPPPFNLTELQLEAARIFGLSPAKTLEIAESLYLDSLISYPRTNSEKLPKTIDNTSILRRLESLPKLGVYASELLRRGLLRPREGEREDPAHPAIHPTGYLPGRRLRNTEADLYEMIVRRYLASFYPEAVVEEISYTLVEPSTGLRFRLSGRRVLRYEWLKVYTYKRVESAEVPSLTAGTSLAISSARLVKVYSKPPTLYSKATILRWMEEVGIGTEATRAEIIETIFRRGYVRGSRIEVTELGLDVARILSTLFKEVTEVELTREFERKLREIASGVRTKEDVIEEAKAKLREKLLEVKKMLFEDRVEVVKEKAGLGSSSTSCAVCGKGAAGSYGGLSLCLVHGLAYENVVRAYRSWSEGAGVGFEDYLRTLLKLRSTGRYAREVAEYLIKRVR